MSSPPIPVSHPRVERYAEADIPTRYGQFRAVTYRVGSTDPALPVAPEPIAMVKGDVSSIAGVHTRVHSECLTGEVFGSLKCDCREQLEYAMRHVADEGIGVVLYLRQEGRGIGLGNKIRAYALQAEGHDTVDANRMLGFEDDQRTYDVAAAMIRDLGIESVALLTNNPAKVDALRSEGIEVVARLPVHIPPNPHSREYLLAKRARMGHALDLPDLLLDAE